MKKLLSLALALVMVMSLSLALADVGDTLVTFPEFTPAEVEAGAKIYDPVEEFSDETADGPIWKYMLLDTSAEGLEPTLLNTLTADTVGVWRSGDGASVTYWAGVGRSTDLYPDNHYFEMNTDPGSQKTGLLVFVAPESGTYTMPAFVCKGVGSGAFSKLAILKNGVVAYESDEMMLNDTEVEIPEQTFELEAGDTLTFLAKETGMMYIFIQMDSMTLVFGE